MFTTMFESSRPRTSPETPRALRARAALALAVACAATLAAAGRAHAQPEALDEETILRAERASAWLLRLSFDERERQIFRAVLLLDWQTAPAAQRARLDPQLALLEQVQAAAPARRELARLKLSRELLAELEAQPQSPVSRFLLAQHAAAHPPLAPGEPALTREMSDALADLVGFVLFEAAGVSQSPVPAGVKAEVAVQLANGWPSMSRAQQERIARAPLQHAALRWQWPQLAESQRRLARAAWRRALGPALAGLPPPRRTPGGGARWARDLAELERRIDDHDRTIDLLGQVLDVRRASSLALVSHLVASAPPLP